MCIRATFAMPDLKTFLLGLSLFAQVEPRSDLTGNDRLTVAVLCPV